MAIMNINSPGLAAAVNQESYTSHVPNFVLAGMYEAGFQGDPHTLATTLEKWYNATGGTSWLNALAAYHAGSVQGVNDPHAQDYAKSVLRASQNAPSALLGAFSAGSALALGGVELAGGLLAGAGALALGGEGGAAGATAAAGGAEGAAAGTAGGGAAGAAAKGALSGAASTAAKGGLAGLLGATAWAELGVRLIEALAGAALVLLGLQALTGGSGSPVEAVKTVAKRMA